LSYQRRGGWEYHAPYRHSTPSNGCDKRCRRLQGADGHGPAPQGHVSHVIYHCGGSSRILHSTARRRRCRDHPPGKVQAGATGAVDQFDNGDGHGSRGIRRGHSVFIIARSRIEQRRLLIRSRRLRRTTQFVMTTPSGILQPGLASGSGVRAKGTTVGGTLSRLWPQALIGVSAAAKIGWIGTLLWLSSHMILGSMIQLF